MLKRTWDFDFLGVLPSNELMRARFDKQGAFVNSQNMIQYFILPISEIPSNFPNAPYFTGYQAEIEMHSFEDHIELTDIQRQEELYKFFSDVLAVFQPVKKGDRYYVSNVRLTGKPNGFSETTKYVPVPVFSKETHPQITSFDEFIKRLQENKFLGKITGISTDENDTPSLVLWKESEFSYKVVGIFEKHRFAQGGYLLNCRSLHAIEFEENWFDDVVRYDNPTLIFVAKDLHMQMLEGLESSPELTPDINISGYASSQSSSSGEAEIEHTITESQFINEFIQFTREMGYSYDAKDLINFHTAMKSSNLVILAGTSGTGKSQLVQLYGRALGLKEEMAIIPVRPGWTDDADLIGYVDGIHMIYKPGDYGLVNTLISASKHPESLYIICFDEMNLSRVEHYFSQFLSVLEMEGTNRALKLYNEEAQPRLYNGSEFPHTIPIGDNVLFVGTVNIDESTFHFSDKVLDRANVIKLNVLDFHNLKAVDRKKKQERRQEITFDHYHSFIQEEELIVYPEQEINFLNDLNQCLRSSNQSLIFGPRVVKQIMRYLGNLPDLPDSDVLRRREAFDIQIVQRILTKLRGPEEKLKQIVGTYNVRTNQIENGTIYQILDNYSDISDFTNTREVLNLKARELRAYGYSI